MAEITALTAPQADGISAAQTPHQALMAGQAGRREVQVLVAESGSWFAGQTTEAPDDTNTTDASEYLTSVYPGHFWPYMVPSSQMAHDTVGYYPSAFQNTNINAYRHGFLLPPNSFVNGAKVEIELEGDYIQSNANARFFEFIVEPEADPNLSFQSSKCFAFQSDDLPAAAISGPTSRNWSCKITGVASGLASGNWIHRWDARFTFENSTASGPAPLQNIARCDSWAIPTTTVDFTKAVLMNVRFKNDASGTALGATGGSAGVQSTADGLIRCGTFRVTLYPGQH